MKTKTDRTKELEQSDIFKLHTYCEQKTSLNKTIADMKTEVLELKIAKLEKPEDKLIADKCKVMTFKLRKLEMQKKLLKPHIDPRLYNVGDYFIHPKYGKIEIAEYIYNKYWKISHD